MVLYRLKNKKNKRWNNVQNLGLDRDPDSSKSMDPDRDTINRDSESHCSYEQCSGTVVPASVQVPVTDPDNI